MQDNSFHYSNNAGNHNRFPKDPLPPEKKKFTFEKTLIIGFLLFVAGSLAYNHFKKSQEEEEPVKTEEVIQSIQKERKIETASKPSVISEDDESVVSSQSETSETTSGDILSPQKQGRAASNRKDYSGLTTSEMLERKAYESVVEQARSAGVSTEGSTSEILERITHANVVEQARRAGVSTKGTTSEILDRITRKNLEDLGY
jgi:hypothetical protein